MSTATGAAPFSEAEKHATAGVGSSHPNQQSHSQSPAAKQRSCVTCRQRKVRCDKLSPCTNCRRADIPCVLPSTERPPRWARRLKQQQQQQEQQQQQQHGQQPSLAQPAPSQTAPLPQHDPSNPTDVSAVLDRLRQLEALVRDLSAGNASATGAAPVSNTYTQPPLQPPTSSASTAQQPPEAAAVPIRERFGRLILDDDTSKRSRYVSSGFWSTINDELDVVRRDTNSRAAADPGGGGVGGFSDGDDDDDDSDGVLSDNDDEHEAVGGLVPPGSAGASRSATAAQTPSGTSGRAAMSEAAHRSIADRNAFLFGHNLQPPLGNAADYRPLPSQIPFLFQVYVVNVNMLSQIVHVPTINKIIEGLVGGTTNDIEKHRLASVDAAMSNANNADETTGKEPVFELTPASEALMFAIYYAAVISMEEEDVVQNFGISGAELSLKYRIGLELSLASADFLNTSDLEIVQALVIFLMLCRRYDSPRFVWMLTGLVIRMAMALGLHRDGSNFGNSLSPYEVEMRRRVWCTVCALDVRSSEDQGTDLTIMPSSYDTRFPLSINDSDIDPDSKETPRERDEMTDMTYALLNFEVTGLAQRMMASAKQASMSNGAASGNEGTSNASSGEQFLQEQNRMLEEVHRKLEARYLRHSPDTSGVIYWTSVTITRLFMAKMTLILNLPRLLQVDKSSSALSTADEDLRTRLLSSAIDVAEYNDALKTEKACRRWRWLCETYTQWHTIAFLLIETGRRPWDPAVERAWAALHGSHLIPAPPKKKSKESKEPANQPATQSSRAASISANSAGGASNSNSNKTNKSNKTSATNTSKTSSASESSQFFWLPLRRLMARARRHRASELARLRADTKAARDLEIAYDLAVADGRSRPTSNPAAVDAFRERWRRLVGLDRADQGSSSSDTARGNTSQSPASSAPNPSTQSAANAGDTSWDTSIRPYNNMLVGPSPSGPAINRFLDPRAPASSTLRNFSDLTEQEYKSHKFPGGPGTASMHVQPGPPGPPGKTPAPNSIDEFILSTSGHTPKPDPLVAQRWKGFDPWQIWDGQGAPGQSRNAAVLSHEAASRPDMGFTSGLPFVGVAGVDPVNMDFNVDFPTEPMAGQLLFDEDLDIDMDVEPNIDWDNWFESARGF
ncbi:fungal specific transcription factor [Ophiostoma piceae UAMH 11346]|uniref:Fungal specific transcription factor n=1 Tax=Ophiostoma piceae (strain UAMH 11346) TaxID=1262450 RepID=S3BU69_OPHP1|nr:fungal specific transcription factor [Ophiostoma piceae UAMH 11346]